MWRAEKYKCEKPREFDFCDCFDTTIEWRFSVRCELMKQNHDGEENHSN